MSFRLVIRGDDPKNRMKSMWCNRCDWWLDVSCMPPRDIDEKCGAHARSHQTYFEYHRPTLREILEGKR